MKDDKMMTREIEQRQKLDEQLKGRKPLRPLTDVGVPHLNEDSDLTSSAPGATAPKDGTHIDLWCRSTAAASRSREGAVNHELFALLIDRLEKQWPEVVAQDEIISNICRSCVPSFGAVLISRHPPAVPEGWKLVPVEPTEEMCKAGEDCDGNSSSGNDLDGSWIPENVEKIYRAMLSASPSPKETDNG